MSDLALNYLFAVLTERVAEDMVSAEIDLTTQADVE